ncbi:MAG: TetR family transcriptional regulator [Bdellovibrionales bacterium]|nr:TetR family transcriptional regulator [Bdellovibrionales bacterium]
MSPKKEQTSTSDKILRQILEFRPSKADQRRALILEAVIEGIGEGLEGSTVERISKRTKMRRSHVQYYFKNREEMLDAAIKYVISVSQEINVEYLKDLKSPEAMLRAYVEATFEWFVREPTHRSVMGLLMYFSTCFPRHRHIMQQIADSSEERLQAILKLKKSKKGKGDKAAKALAKTIRTLVIGALIDLHSTEGKDTQAAIQSVQDTVQALAEEFWQ